MFVVVVVVSGQFDCFECCFVIGIVIRYVWFNNERKRKKQDEDVRALGGLVSRQSCKQLYLLVNEATTASVAS